MGKDAFFGSQNRYTTAVDQDHIALFLAGKRSLVDIPGLP